MLIGTGVVLWTAAASRTIARSLMFTMISAAGVAAVRVFVDADQALDVAAAGLLCAVVATVGGSMVVGRTWPRGAFVIALVTVAAVGAYLRAHELARTLDSTEPLQPDVRYYQQQALRTANPFAAGEKSPLWPALHAPLMRTLSDPVLAMRVLSWSFGILMVPVVAFGIGRLFEPAVGIVVAAGLAVNPFLIDLCTKGLREELGVCLWMGVLVLLFGRRKPPAVPILHTAGAEIAEPGRSCRQAGMCWPRVAAAGTSAGVLLLLRNTDAPVLMVLVTYGLARMRIGWPRVAVGVALPVAIALPFYVNQWRAHGDPFYLEKRDARYHANLEFINGGGPAGLTLPDRATYDRDAYAGDPVSPAAYLFKFHTPSQVILNQWTGLKRVVLGDPFSSDTSIWMRLACAAGLLATLLSARTRFAALFVAGSVLGIRAHLIALGGFEERLLLPVLVVWLAAGWWLIATAVRVGLLQWLAFRGPIPTKGP